MQYRTGSYKNLHQEDPAEEEHDEQQQQQPAPTITSIRHSRTNATTGAEDARSGLHTMVGGTGHLTKTNPVTELCL